MASALVPVPDTSWAESSLEQSLTASTASAVLPPARSRIFKIIVIGDSNVGKTCLTYRFCGGRFPQRTEATIGVDFRERTEDIDGEKIKVTAPVFSNLFKPSRIGNGPLGVDTVPNVSTVKMDQIDDCCLKPQWRTQSCND